MPTYNFRNNETGEEFERLMSISERTTFLEENPNISQVLSAPALGDSVRLGFRKIDRGFNDLLSKVKKDHRDSTINTL